MSVYLDCVQARLIKYLQTSTTLHSIGKAYTVLYQLTDVWPLLPDYSNISSLFRTLYLLLAREY